MSKNSAKKIVKDYINKLKTENYIFSSVYLFGSHAQNRAGKWSDIDVAVISDKFKRNFWENESLLGRYSLDIDTRIEPHGFTVDDFKNNTDPMVYEIKRTGIRIA